MYLTLHCGYLQTTVLSIKKSTQRVMQETSNKVLKQQQDGNKIGSCASILINAMFLVSPKSKNLSNLPINSMVILLRKLIQLNTLASLCNQISNGININNITSKANQTLGFLRRNLKVNSRKTYKALVRPNLEYSSCVSDPQTTNQINQLEKVQSRAAKFVCGRFHNTSSVTEMLEDLDWPLLQVRRLRTRLIMFYKIIHYQIAIYPSDLLIPVDTIWNETLKSKLLSTNQDKQGHLQILFLSPDHIAMEPTPIIRCY